MLVSMEFVINPANEDPVSKRSALAATRILGDTMLVNIANSLRHWAAYCYLTHQAKKN